MSQETKTKDRQDIARLLERLTVARKKLPESWTKAAGLIRNARQRRALERHVKKIHSEWR